MSSRVISGIFDAKEPEFSHKIHDLERLSGGSSHDIRIFVDALHHFKDLSQQLNLDKDDTTLRELYHSLIAQSKKDSFKLAEYLEISQSDTPRQAIEKCASYLEKKVAKRKFWCIKQSVIKKQLKANLPKKVLKILGFRSIDSLLKGEPTVQTLILADIIENSNWRKKYIEQASSITNSDFDEQSITIKSISHSRLASLKKAKINLNQIVFSSQESSDIIVAPPTRRFDGDVMFYFDTIVNHINGIINRSAFYRYKGLRPDFFKSIRNVRENGFKRSSSITWPIRWSVVLHSIQYQNNYKLADNLDLNVPAEGLFSLSTAKEFNGLGIWEKGLVHSDKNGLLVSTNISDAIINAINKNKFEDSYTEFGKNRLYDELFSRYLTHDRVIDNIFKEESI